MSDTIADEARLLNVTAAIIAELARQHLAKEIADLGLDPEALAQAVIKAADGVVIQFPPPLVP